ncbi:hypothetical protein BK120_22905 [Paenibacillus sp. FSL A5-0031]|uniref:hypothetical protein n=1 Tax=Paenibacillus sp. FSL A5-0031 TaxID=1920420 RepID=UPI00096C473B|nr:hypothetical protein [Paenibacillus sp. FSL A5-0031]OME78591.1 hypothetical protein BK120_22905 [Paenibacillus sp. FSL A5-0031]
MAQEIEVTLRIRISDEQLHAAGMTVAQFAQNVNLDERGLDIPSVVLSQEERDTAIVMTKVIVGIKKEHLKQTEEQFMRDYYGNDN